MVFQKAQSGFVSFVVLDDVEDISGSSVYEVDEQNQWYVCMVPYRNSKVTKSFKNDLDWKKRKSQGDCDCQPKG